MVVWCTQILPRRQQFHMAWPSHVTTKQYLIPHFRGYSKCTAKSHSPSFRITCNKSTVSLLESGEQRCIKAIIIIIYHRVQELCESRGGRPGLSILTSLTVSVDVKQHWTVLRCWSQFVPNMLTDIRGHEQSSGAVWKSRWTSWAPVPNKPTVSVDIKQLFNQEDMKLYLTTTIIYHLLLASMNLSRGVRSEEESCSLTLEMSLGWRMSNKLCPIRSDCKSRRILLFKWNIQYNIKICKGERWGEGGVGNGQEGVSDDNNNNDRLFMAPHLIRAWSVYKDIRICSCHHTLHMPVCTHTRTHTHTDWHQSGTHDCMNSHTYITHARLLSIQIRAGEWGGGWGWGERKWGTNTQSFLRYASWHCWLIGLGLVCFMFLMLCSILDEPWCGLSVRCWACEYTAHTIV